MHDTGAHSSSEIGSNAASEAGDRLADEDLNGLMLKYSEGPSSQFIHLTKDGLLRFSGSTNCLGVGSSLFLGRVTRVERQSGTKAHEALIHYYDANAGVDHALEINSALLPKIEAFMKRHEISCIQQGLGR